MRHQGFLVRLSPAGRLLLDDEEPLDENEEGREVFDLNEPLPSLARLECLRLGLSNEQVPSLARLECLRLGLSHAYV
jgi:hypothetical protein